MIKMIFVLSETNSGLLEKLYFFKKKFLGDQTEKVRRKLKRFKRR